MAKELTNKNIGIIGPGAIGSLLASLFFRAGNRICCIGTLPAVESIKRNGIQIKSSVYGNFISRPNSSTNPSSIFDLVFVTVKSYELKNSLKTMTDCIGNDTLIVILLNGIGNREIIRSTYSGKVIVGTIGAIEVSLGENRIVNHISPMIPHIEIASDSDVKFETLTNIAALIKSAGLSVTIGKNENEVMWRKLIRLCAVATMTAISDLPIGKIRSESKLRGQLEQIVSELCSIALTQGFDCSVVDVMWQIDTLPENMTTSMQRDIKFAKFTEIESILGEPIKLGNKLGLNLPCMKDSYLYLMTKIGN
jgi:2-dehydropantoate 2-reductase